MHGDQRAMRGFELAQRRARHFHTPTRRPGSSCGAAARNACAVAPTTGGRPRNPLQPQQPELEVARQRLDRHAGRDRVRHRGAKPEQRLVRIRLRRPLVDQLGEVADVAERARRPPPTRAIAAVRRSRDAPDRAARVPDTRRGRRSAARAPRRTAVGSAARSSRRRASCRDRASGTRRCDPTHRACKSVKSGRRWYGAASRGGI